MSVSIDHHPKADKFREYLIENNANFTEKTEYDATSNIHSVHFIIKNNKYSWDYSSLQVIFSRLGKNEWRKQSVEKTFAMYHPDGGKSKRVDRWSMNWHVRNLSNNR